MSDLQKVYTVTFAMRHLHNTPDQALSLLKNNTVIINFIQKFYKDNKQPNTIYDMHLFALAAYKKLGNNPDLKNLDYRDEDYWLRADRFNKAKNLLVSNIEESEVSKISDDYKESANGFLQTYNMACQIDSTQKNDTALSTKSMWDEKFNNLSEEQKADFLGRALASCHASLIFTEVWNSAFSKETVERDNDYYKKSNMGFHNVAHSMIYNTYQKNSVYELGKNSFNYEMNNTAKKGGFLEEYPFHKMIISILEKMENINGQHDKLVDIITEFWNKNKNPIFGAYVTEALSHLNPNRAASNLLKLIQTEKGEKNHLSSILYRIEFGKIGISKEGVNYLEKTYDLGEYNNPSFYVERLTPKGEIGIFNEEKNLIKYFELRDITIPEKKIKAEVLDFIYETLYYPKKEESIKEKEERLKYLEEFKTKYYKLAKDNIFSETGVKLNNLTFKEQGSFLQYLSSTENQDKLKKFLIKYHENGAKTFISTQKGSKEMGDKILELGEKLPEDTAKMIFTKYGEYIDAVNGVEEFINKTYKLPPSLELINKTKENLLIRGKDLLIKQNSKVIEGKFSEKEFLESLENTRADVDLFKNIFKIAIEENPDTSFDDFTDLKPERINTKEQITKEDLSDMYKIIEKNYPEEKLRKAVLESFQKAIDSGSDSTDFNLLKRDKKIIAFDRIDHQKDNSIYFGSFNVDPAYCSSKIGAAFFQATIMPKMKEKVVRANCSSRQPIASYYIESGFVANKSYEFAGEPSLSLESNPKKHFMSKDLSKEEIINKFLENEKTKDILINAKDSQEELLSGGIPEGYALTRYFFNKKEKKWFSVLEKVKN